MNLKIGNASYYFLVALSLWVFSCIKSPSAPATNAFENEIKALEAKDKTETYPPHSILFIGSSSIRLWKTIATDMDPLPVIQRGFGGSRFTDVLYYTPRLVYPHQFKAVVLFVANDIVGSPTDKTPEQVENMFRQFTRLIRKKNSKAPIFYIAVTPTPLRWSVWPQINEANQRIAQYCQSQENLYYINTTSAYLNEQGQPIEKYFIGDKLHQNADGYAVWSKIIKESLVSHLK